MAHRRNTRSILISMWSVGIKNVIVKQKPADYNTIYTLTYLACIITGMVFSYCKHRWLYLSFLFIDEDVQELKYSKFSEIRVQFKRIFLQSGPGTIIYILIGIAYLSCN